MTAPVDNVRLLLQLRDDAPRLIRDAIDEVITCLENNMPVASEVAQLLSRYIQRTQQQDRFGK